MTEDDRLRVHPHERLAGSVNHVSLVSAAAQLRAEPHAATLGHRQITVARNGPLTLVLFVFERDGMLKTHQTDGEVTIHVLAGEFEVVVDSGPMVVRRGELVMVAPRQPHSVRAIEPGEMLLSICRNPTE